jgi:hypothetical protein
MLGSVARHASQTAIVPLVALKLTLIPLSILAASLVSRRFGHAIGGVVAGLPLIAGPIIAILLIEQSALQVAPIATATLHSVPAALTYIASFAWLARYCRWWQCLAGATVAFWLMGWLLLHSDLPPFMAVGLALAAPILALLLMPRVPHLSGGVHVPGAEIVVRMAVAVVVAALIVFGSESLPARVSGLLLVWPITGSVLPCFTLPLHGAVATINLLRGFANGLFGFVTFFAVLSALLPRLADAAWGKTVAFTCAFAASLLAALIVHRVRHTMATE